MSKWTRTTCFALVLLTCVGSVAAQAQNVDVTFRWDNSRNLESGRLYLPKELSYLVFLQKGDEPERFVASVNDTIYTLSAEPGVAQRIRVQAIDEYGTESVKSAWSDPIYFEENETPSIVPTVAQMKPNYPNPFNPQTRVVYGVPVDLASGDRVQLDIYSVQGQLVRSLEVDRSPGWHEAIWDGMDNHGSPASAGLYMARYVAGTMVETHKMTMVK